MNLTTYKKIDVPQKPGVYFWKQGSDILYIGKATNLKNRTNSYLQKKLMDRRGPLISKMIDISDGLEWRETESVLEALILETYLIKKHKPIYNSKEKDNKSHNYVVITNENPARVYTVRGRMLQTMENKNIILKSFGPFPQGQLLREALRIIKKIFPFLGKKKNAKYGNEFYKQIGQLPDTKNDFDLELYKKNIEYIALLFSGKKQSIIQKLKSEMKKYAADENFERAARLRNQISSLVHIRDIALMKHDFETSYYTEQFRIEAYDIAHLQGESMVGVMVVHNGVTAEPENYRLFNIRTVSVANDLAALTETLERRMGHTEWPQADMIVVDGGMIQKRAMERVLRRYELKIPVVALVKDDKHKAKGMFGQKKLLEKYKKQILAINTESHRFAITAHKKQRRKKFLQ